MDDFNFPTKRYVSDRYWSEGSRLAEVKASVEHSERKIEDVEDVFLYRLRYKFQVFLVWSPFKGVLRIEAIS